MLVHGSIPETTMIWLGTRRTCPYHARIRVGACPSYDVLVSLHLAQQQEIKLVESDIVNARNLVQYDLSPITTQPLEMWGKRVLLQRIATCFANVWSRHGNAGAVAVAIFHESRSALTGHVPETTASAHSASC